MRVRLCLRASATRQAIRRTLDRQAVEVWALLAGDVADANRELSRRPAPSLRPELPRHAGQAHRLRAVRRRIDRSMQALRDASFLPPSGVGDEVAAAHRQLAQALDEAVQRHYGEWAGAVDKQALARLEVPVLVRSREQPGTIDVNFDRSLLKTFAEVFYWDRMSFEVPHYATDVYSRCDELRALRENVLLVVRDYNRIVNSLTPEERPLFRDRIRSLDKRLHVGLSKLHWSSHEIAAFFVMECRAHSSKVQMLVDSFKAASSEIARGCRRMSETLLLRIDDHDEEEVEEEVEEVEEVVEVEGHGRRNRRVFSAGEFVPEQRRRRDAALGRLLREHEGLLALLRRTHEAFRSDGAEVQQCWAQHMERVERRVQEALRVNVRRSLQALARALGVAGTGVAGVAGVAGGADGAAAPSPLFRVLVGLQQQPVQASGTPQVEFEPSLALLSEEVSGVSAAVCAAVSAFKRLALSPDDDAGGEPRELIPCIAESEEIRKIRLAIDAGMAQNAAQLQAYLKTWVAYREIWEINKDAFIRRYQRQNPPVSSFDGDIGRYAEVANNVQKEETVLSVQFVLLDCSPLKLSLLRHCSEWQAKLTSLLADMAGGQLRDLHAYLSDNGERVSRPPRTLDELGDALRLLGALQAEGPRVAARLGPIHEQFAILHKHEVPVDAEVRRQQPHATPTPNHRRHQPPTTAIHYNRATTTNRHQPTPTTTHPK
ncbi:dynein axonemal heavy chain 2-like [Petromyzon marinus]|uniref:dynein axonemal heavy chain 2-like n=1 Tax=Petromyzon marinus TaxID=7757 RepID=UPI003F70BD28